MFILELETNTIAICFWPLWIVHSRQFYTKWPFALYTRVRF